MLITKRLRFEKDIISRIARTLPGKGKLNVSVGQEVTPDEVIGTAVVSSGFRIINLATLLEATPSSTENCLQRKVGEKIYKGELLAYKGGGILKQKRFVTAPTDGVIDFINTATGEVKLSFLPKTVNLPAAVFGVVEAVDEVRGQALIKTELTKIYGIFGSGRTRDGILHIMEPKSDLISPQNVSAKDADCVLVGRGLIYRDAISAAISWGAAGIITGGINAKDYRGMAGGRLTFPKKIDSDIGISLVVCEGFGLVPIGEDIFNLLYEHDQKFVFIDGNRVTVSLPSFSSASMKRIKQTQLSPLKGDLKQRVSFLESANVELGMRIRVAGMTYLGEQGKIIRIDKSKTKLASGIFATLLTIETKTRKIQVPDTNVEII